MLNERFEIEVIDNPYFDGFWIGIFTKVDESKIQVDFQENIQLKGIISKVFSYLFFDIKKTVDNYIEDLAKSFEEK
ncbi:MAG: hypothetical protein GDA46_01580 [Bdellovibrionales bacterium]|nr:hypothetical protein [Bdellovibrionales bacterium]